MAKPRYEADRKVSDMGCAVREAKGVNRGDVICWVPEEYNATWVARMLSIGERVDAVVVDNPSE